MRLLQLRKTLERGLWSLNNLVFAEPDGVGRVKIKNLKEIRLAVDEIAEAGLFEKEVQRLTSGPIYQTLADEILIPPGAVEALNLRVEEFRDVIKNLQNALSAFVDDSPDVIAIRLPPTTNFDELISIANELKKCISIPIAEPEIGGEVRIQSVDNGSIWIYVALGTPAALTLVAGLAWAAAVIYKKIQEGKAFREYVENLRMKNEQTELFLDAQRSQVAALIIEQAKEVEKANFSESDPERLERLKLSIGTMAELTKNGFEIHPSILASEEVKNLFPDFKSIHLPSFSLKQIGEGGQEEPIT